MIETEQQRRWWFATHPEFSWSRKGSGTTRHEQEKESAGKFRPEKDEASKFESGPIVELLRSLKRIIEIGRDAPDALSRYLLERNPYGHISTVRWPKLPTSQEFYRGPNAMIRESLRAFDRILPPLAIDEEYVKGSRALWKEFQKRLAEPGPGEWVLVPRSPVGLEHQSRMSGSPIIKKDGKYHIYEYEVPNPSGGDPVQYDNYGKGVYYEEKGPMGNLVNRETQEFHPWCKERMRARKQAESQVKAARGGRVIWRVGADQMKAYEKALHGIKGIKIEP